MNHRVLTWARETAGLSLEEGAQAVGLNDAYGQKGFERLALMEQGKAEPTRSVLARMAKAYRRSLVVFYLNEPPKKGDRGHDFRRVAGNKEPLYDADLDALIRDITGRQSVVKSLLEDLETEKLAFIDSETTATPANVLAEKITKHINFSLARFRAMDSSNLAFAYLRSMVEDAGVFVVLLGDLGSHHTKISTDAFRGFAIADPIAPFAVVNDQDAKTAWSFTVVHELAHLWLGETGLSGASATLKIEQYCNDVAGQFLLPTAEIQALGNIQAESFDSTVATISTFADERNISRSMVSYRLFQLNIISEGTWTGLSTYFRDQWLQFKSKEAEKQKANESGPSYYVVRRHRLGNALLGLVQRSLNEGLITYTKAGQVLGVKPRNVDPLLKLTTKGIQ